MTPAFVVRQYGAENRFPRFGQILKNEMLGGIRGVMGHFKRYFQEESGATAVEYGLLIGILAVALYLGLSVYYQAMLNLFGFISTTVSTALGL